MALELQISTQQANQAIQQIERSLDSLRASLDRVGNEGSAFSNLVTQLRSISVDPGQVQNVGNLANALKGLNAVKDVTALASGMRALAAIDFNKLATDFNRFVTQLNSLTVPASFYQIVSGFNQINAAAQQVNATLQRTVSTNNQAGSSFNNLRGTIAPVNNLLAAFGVSLGAVGFGNFVRASFDATSALQSFQAQMSALYGGTDVGAQTRFAAEQFQFLRRVARETGRDIQDLLPAYSRWTQSTVRSGVSARDSAADFYRLNVVFRVFGLSAEQAAGSMRAFEQMMSKGKVQMEELRGQLGDRGVPAVAAMARALGVTTDKLQEMMAAGQVSSREVTKLINALYEMAAPGLPAAMRTLDATMNLFKNTITELNLAFGMPFFEKFTSGFKLLEEALASPAVMQAMANIGSFLGQFASGFSAAMAVAVMFGAEVVNAISAVMSVIGNVATAMFSWIPGFDQLAASGITVAQAIGFAAGVIMTFVAAGALVWTVNAAFRAVMVTLALLNVLTSAWRVAVLGVVIAIAGVTYIISRFRGDTETASQATGVFNSMLGQLTGTALDTASTMSDTAEEYTNVAGAASNTTRRTNEQTDATRRAAQESRNMNAAMRNETAERTRLDHSMQNLINSQNGATQSANSHTTALNGVSAASGGASTSGNNLNSVLGSNVGGFNSAAAAARSYGAALEWVTATGDRVPVLSRSVPQGTPRNVTQEASNNSWYTGWNQSTQSYNNSPTANANDSDKPGSYQQNTVAYDPVEYYNSPSYQNSGNYIDSSPYTYDKASEGDYGYMQKGGIVGSAVESRRAPLSLWNGARRFADGGYTPGSGEVPIIAHQGEAVVPLPDGRSIPVSFTGEFIDSIRAIGVVFKNESDRWIQALQQQTLVLDVIANKINLGSTSTSTGTGTSGSGTTSPTAPANQPDTPTAVASRRSFFGGGYTAPGAIGIVGDNGQVTVRTPDGAGFGGSSNLPRYAAGTPNTSGGITAILHPNEAVIPLPDGRRVPVELREPADKASPLRRAVRDPAITSTTGSSSSGNVTVNMYVNTPDAKSFAASQDQMLTELQTKIERAKSRIGFGGSVDDPTIRKV